MRDLALISFKQFDIILFRLASIHPLSDDAVYLIQHHHFHDSICARYFCEKCKQIVCRECTVVLHKSHKYRYMEQSSTVKEIVDTLKSLTMKVQSKVATAEKALEDVNTTTDLITASITGLKNSVHNTATEMVRHIRLAEEEMINEIDRIQSKKFHGLKKQTKQLQNCLETFEYGKIYAEHSLKYLSEVRIEIRILGYVYT